jgi:hypothetical protein
MAVTDGRTDEEVKLKAVFFKNALNRKQTLFRLPFLKNKKKSSYL